MVIIICLFSFVVVIFGMVLMMRKLGLIDVEFVNPIDKIIDCIIKIETILNKDKHFCVPEGVERLTKKHFKKYACEGFIDLP